MVTKQNSFVPFITLFIVTSLWGEQIELTKIAPDLSEIVVTVQLDKDESLSKELSFSVNNPNFHVRNVHATSPLHTAVDRNTGISRDEYKGAAQFIVSLVKDTPGIDDSAIQTTLFFHYGLFHPHKTPAKSSSPYITHEKQFALTAQPEEAPLPPKNNPEQERTKPGAPTRMSASSVGMPSCALESRNSLGTAIYATAQGFIRSITNFIAAKKAYISGLFTNTQSRTVQMGLALLLGILMSLTPCIYPMIPITIGLLGTSASNSFMRNFTLALSYTLGLATVFALLGFATVFFGSQCGALFCNPWFVILLILFLAYCGGSMLGLYEFYIPRFLQPSSHQVQKGSLVSAFVFGMASGTFASPCMSPGLALVLTAVASIGNYFLGFLLLFMFGIGASMPLLIIGTFSGSIGMLPRAGLWMDDIKKFFGFMLIMTCFYYAQSLAPQYAILWAAAGFTIVCSIVYGSRIFHTRTKIATFFTACVTCIMLTGGLLLIYSGFTAYHAQQCTRAMPEQIAWRTDYAGALAQARAEGKLVLLDFTASWCSLCVLLDKKILKDPDVLPVFDTIIPVKVDGSLSSNALYAELVDKFEVLGLPTLLLINPENEEIIKLWNSELLEHPAQDFAQEILAIAKKHTKHK